MSEELYSKAEIEEDSKALEPINDTPIAPATGIAALAAPRGFDQVSVVASINVGLHACAPVPHLKASDSQRPQPRFPLPVEFADFAITLAPAQQVGRVSSGYHGRMRTLQHPERQRVEMIQVRVREKDEIDRWKRRGVERRRYQAFQTNSKTSHADAAAISEHRVRENRDAIQFQ